MPKVSVLILTCNRPHLIGRAIESVIRQEYQDWEIVIVHDGPNELTTTVAREWQGRDRRIRYFHRQTPGNIAEATNFGIARARGEYMAILDDDDYWAAPDKLARQVAFLNEQAEYVACGGGAIVVDRENTETLRYLKPEDDAAIKGRALLANPMIHSTLLYRRSTALAVGGYNAALAGFQDWDFVLNLGLAGKLYNFPAYFLYYCLWAGGGSFQQSAKNTRCAISIVWSHKRRYAHSTVALGLACLYHAYAHLPLWIRSRSFAFLARLKKIGFSGQTPAAVGPNS
jgi:glycosyltransferase involved in cell wall biosynthesis